MIGRLISWINGFVIGAMSITIGVFCIYAVNKEGYTGTITESLKGVKTKNRVEEEESNIIKIGFGV